MTCWKSLFRVATACLENFYHPVYKVGKISQPPFTFDQQSQEVPSSPKMKSLALIVGLYLVSTTVVEVQGIFLGLALLKGIIIGSALSGGRNNNHHHYSSGNNGYRRSYYTREVITEVTLVEVITTITITTKGPSMRSTKMDWRMPPLNQLTKFLTNLS